METYGYGRSIDQKKKKEENKCNSIMKRYKNH